MRERSVIMPVKIPFSQLEYIFGKIYSRVFGLVSLVSLVLLLEILYSGQNLKI